jgi:hypothetical protein
MNGFKVDEKSWHYRLNANIFWAMADIRHIPEDDSWYMKTMYSALPKDFCTYWRHVMWSLLLSVVLIGLVSSVSFLVGAALFALFQGGVTSLWGILIAIGLIVSLYCIAYGLVKLQDTVLKKYVWPHVQRFLSFFVGKPLAFVYDWTLKPLFIGIIDFVVWLYGLLPEPKPSTADIKVTKIKKPRRPSLIMQWYRAVKNKYCPMIEYDGL